MHKAGRAPIWGMVVLLAALMLHGCSNESTQTVITVRIHQMRCTDGFVQPKIKSDAPPRCEGESVEAGVFDYRLSPLERRSLVRTVTQDENNASLSLYELTNCKIWDKSNWECHVANDAYSDSIVVHNGAYSHEFRPSLGRSNYYIGTVQFEPDSLVQRVLSWR